MIRLKQTSIALSDPSPNRNGKKIIVLAPIGIREEDTTTAINTSNFKIKLFSRVLFVGYSMTQIARVLIN